MTRKDYFALYRRTRPFGPEPWWAVLERYELARTMNKPFYADGPHLVDGDEMDDEEYTNWVADMHEQDGCCCCLQAEGRWPPGLPHWSCIEGDPDLDGGRWLMPDGSRVTPEMFAHLKARFISAWSNPPPPGTWTDVGNSSS